MKSVKTTLPGRKDAQRMADALVGSGYAKCASFYRIESVYSWKGKKVRENEYALEAKCADKESAAKAAALVERHHPYEVPMVIVLDARASRTYEKWLGKKMRRKGRRKTR